MDAETFLTLLYAGESEVLDFKREQYKFDNSTDEEKSELLKDILAFANAWRDSEAHILIGVEEIQGQKAVIRGTITHLADNNLQQFVNSKTQKPIDFKYESLSIEGKQVGAISIPVQERPFFIKKKFGIVDPDKVYLRRGSSTAVATLDEIFAMGKEAIKVPVAAFEVKTGIKIGKLSSPILSEIILDSLLINRGQATADDLQVIFENEPKAGVFNHMVWEDRISSIRRRIQALLEPLHPSADRPVASWSLGHAGTHEQVLQENSGANISFGIPANYTGGSLSIQLTILARNLPPVKIVIEYSAEEIKNLVEKTFQPRDK